MRVNISANGSVIIVGSPTRLANTGDQAIAGHGPETNAAHAKLAINSPSSAAQFAAQPNPNTVARPQLRLARLLPKQVQCFELLAKFRFFGVGRHTCS